MKLRYVICLAVCAMVASCMPDRRPSDMNQTSNEGQVAPAPAGPTETPTPVISKAAAAQSRTLEKIADNMHARLAKMRDIEKALVLAGEVMDLYKKAIDLNGTDDRLVHKYIRALELKYNLIIPDEDRVDERKKVYAAALDMLERLHPGSDNSIYAEFDIALLLILNNEYYIIFQSIGAVNRTRDNCEKIYAQDRTFEDYSAGTVLGRLHFLAPNIPLIMGWPDKTRSRQYLEEALAVNPDSLLIEFFLADTLYALNEKGKALGYFHDVIKSEPRHDINYFQDKKIQKNCGIRMKELGIN